MYKIIQIILSDNGEDCTAVNFCNCFFDRYCRRVCGAECNNHYEEGPEYWHMIGCLLSNRIEGLKTESDVMDFLFEIADSIKSGIDWEPGDEGEPGHWGK